MNEFDPTRYTWTGRAGTRGSMHATECYGSTEEEAIAEATRLADSIRERHPAAGPQPVEAFRTSRRKMNHLRDLHDSGDNARHAEEMAAWQEEDARLQAEEDLRIGD